MASSARMGIFVLALLLFSSLAFASSGTQLPEGERRSCIQGPNGLLTDASAQLFFDTLGGNIDTSKCRLGTQVNESVSTCSCSGITPPDFYTQQRQCLSPQWRGGEKDGQPCSASVDAGGNVTAEQPIRAWGQCYDSAYNPPCKRIGTSSSAEVIGLDIKSFMAANRLFGIQITGDPPRQWRVYALDKLKVKTKSGGLPDVINGVRVRLFFDEGKKEVTVEDDVGTRIFILPFAYYDGKSTLAYFTGAWDEKIRSSDQYLDKFSVHRSTADGEKSLQFIPPRSQGDVDYPGGSRLYKSAPPGLITTPCPNNPNIIQISLPGLSPTSCIGFDPVFLPDPSGARGKALTRSGSGAGGNVRTQADVPLNVNTLFYESLSRSLRVFGGWNGASIFSGLFNQP